MTEYRCPKCKGTGSYLTHDLDGCVVDTKCDCKAEHRCEWRIAEEHNLVLARCKCGNRIYITEIERILNDYDRLTQAKMLSEELKDKLRNDIPLDASDIIRIAQLESDMEDKLGEVRALSIIIAELEEDLGEERMNHNDSSKTIVRLAKELQQLRAENAGLILMSVEGEGFAETIVRENEQLKIERDALVLIVEEILDVLEKDGDFPRAVPEIKKRLSEATRKEIEDEQQRSKAL